MRKFTSNNTHNDGSDLRRTVFQFLKFQQLKFIIIEQFEFQQFVEFKFFLVKFEQFQQQFEFIKQFILFEFIIVK